MTPSPESPSLPPELSPLAEPMDILLVEDDENDVRITQRALAKTGLPVRLHVVRDGQEALDYLHGRTPFEGRQRPGLVLLDISLPKVNGMDVLRAAKADPGLRPIPILMLTTAAHMSDVATAYAHGANSYLCKPIQYARFVEVMASAAAYWRTLCWSAR